MVIRADELTSLRATVATFQPDAVTITRNGNEIATTTCRLTPVVAHQRLVRLGNVQEYLRLRQWAVYMPEGTNVAVGDLLAADAGTYRVLDATTSGTYSTSTVAYAALADAASDILVTNSVSFQRGNQVIGPVGVGISPVSLQDTITQSGLSFMYTVLFDDAAVRFGDGSAISRNDIIVWDGVANGRASLAYPQRYEPINVAMAYFGDAAP